MTGAPSRARIDWRALFDRFETTQAVAAFVGCHPDTARRHQIMLQHQNREAELQFVGGVTDQVATNRLRIGGCGETAGCGVGAGEIIWTGRGAATTEAE